jgi:hypothetical protein
MPLVVVSTSVLLGFVALAVDSGYLYLAVTESQRTADAAALSGAARLYNGDVSEPDQQLALDVAYDVVAENPVARQEVSADAIVEAGHWEGITRTFMTDVPGRTIQPNALHVVAPRMNIDLFFAPVLGYKQSDVSRDAIAAVSSGRCAGIWGIEGIEGNGNIGTDSYLSSEGPYGSARIYPNGDLCSCQDIRLSGNVEINGDAMYGVGYEFRQDGGSGFVWGVVDDMVCGMIATDADFDYAMFNHNNESIGLTAAGKDPFPKSDNWDLKLTSDDSITLTGGTYYFGSASLAGQSQIVVTGPSAIYVTGYADFTGGGIVNATGDPANLVLHSSAPSLAIKGGSGFYGAVSAPYTDVVLTGTPEYFGTVLGRTVTISGNTWIHVDEKLIHDLFDMESTAPVLVK